MKQVKAAKHILVSAVGAACTKKYKIRYASSMRENVSLTVFIFENMGIEPVGKAYDLFGDGSVQLVNILGHSERLFAVQVMNEGGQYVLLYSDGGHASKSWQRLICSGIAIDKEQQYQSLAWISKMSVPKMVWNLSPTTIHI